MIYGLWSMVYADTRKWGHPSMEHSGSEAGPSAWDYEKILFYEYQESLNSRKTAMEHSRSVRAGEQGRGPGPSSQR